MESFEQRLEKDRNGRVVRWPFRILAALLFGAFGFALLGGVYRFIGAPSVLGALLIFVMLPLAVFMGRTVGCVVWKGRVPHNLYWPFPSGLVLSVWIGLFNFIVYQLSHA
jgi:hypothetical protein